MGAPGQICIMDGRVGWLLVSHTYSSHCKWGDWWSSCGVAESNPPFTAIRSRARVRVHINIYLADHHLGHVCSKPHSRWPGGESVSSRHRRHSHSFKKNEKNHITITPLAYSALRPYFSHLGDFLIKFFLRKFWRECRKCVSLHSLNGKTRYGAPVRAKRYLKKTVTKETSADRRVWHLEMLHSA